MATAEIMNGRIWLQSSWFEKDLIKEIPGTRWSKDEKRWSLNLTWTACVQLRGVFGASLVIGPNLREWAIKEKIRVDRAYEIRNLTSADGNPDLYSFQRAGVQFMTENPSVALCDEMGTGKTIQTLQALAAPGFLPAVVICPNSMKGTWKREARKWLPHAVSYLVKGSAVERRKTFEAASKDPNALVIINIEAVRLHSRTAGFGSIALTDAEKQNKELNDIPFASVVVDEAHRIKDPNSKQTRAVWAVAHEKHVRNRFVLTGTPIAQDASDLWSLLHMISADDFPSKSKFVTRYCNVVPNPFGGIKIDGLRPDTEQEFRKVTDRFIRRMPKALVLPDLPKKVRTRRYVELSAKAMKAYKQMESGCGITRLEDGSIMQAFDNVAIMTRLLQFSSAYMESDGNGGFVMTDPSPKIDAMVEILEEMGTAPLVVAAEHSQLIELAAARLDKLGIQYGKITGDVPQWERDVFLDHFQNGKLRVMLFTMAAGGVGLTMTAADTILFLQRSWNMVSNRQSEDRVHRIGTKHSSVNIIDLIAEGTIEEDQLENYLKKVLRLEEIVQDKVKLQEAGMDTSEFDQMEAALLGSKLTYA